MKWKKRNKMSYVVWSKRRLNKEGSYTLLDYDLEYLMVKRFKDDNIDGYQRALRLDKVDSIVAAAKAGIWIPPILLAIIIDLPGKPIHVVDGQHREEARKRANFKLVAEVRKRTLAQAVADFISINCNARRVPLLLRLSVDRGEYATKLRDMADDYKMGYRQLHNLMDGLEPRLRCKVPANHKAWKVAKVILDLWTIDRRWISRADIYNKPGVLKMVGGMASSMGDDIEKSVKALQTLDYSITGSIASHYGAAGSSQNRMRLMAAQALGVKSFPARNMVP